MKICVFTDLFWNNEKEFLEMQDYINTWKSGIDKHIKYDNIFGISGTKCDNNFKLNNLEVKYPKISPKFYNHLYYNLGDKYLIYWTAAFSSGIFYALLNYDFDILIHIHYAVDINNIKINLEEEIKKFIDSNKLIAAPQQLDVCGNLIDTSFLILKKDIADFLFFYYPIRQLFCKKNYSGLGVEEYFTLLFKDYWYILFPNIPRIRTPQIELIDTENNPIELNSFQKSFAYSSEEDILNLPLVFATKKHLGESLYEKWKNKKK